MKNLAKKLRKLLKNKDILDLIIFGSYAKGKINTSDIDVAVIPAGEVNKSGLRDKIELILNKKVHLQIISHKNYDSPVWLTIFKEGFSVKHNKYLFEILRLQPIKLYKYSLKSLTNSKKVMFERGIKSFKNIKKLSNRVVLVPINETGKFEDFLRTWDLDIDTEEYELLPLVRKGV